MRTLPPFLFASLLLAALVPGRAPAQSLRGSRESIDRMYHQALADELPFVETSAGVRQAVAAGDLVRLATDADVRLHRVGFPWARPAARTFVQRLGAQHRAACGEPLVVTSAIRPATRQPKNAAERSVHPTGMAVDLRKPRKAACLRFLRRTLLALEAEGVIEATEERRPAHFHVAVFAGAYTRYVGGAPAERARTYRVRRGDTLWDIARAAGVTVEALASENALDDGHIRPGMSLRIPAGD